MAAQLANKTQSLETQQERQRNSTEALRGQLRGEMAAMKEAFDETLRVSYDDLLARVENVSETQRLYLQVRVVAVYRAM